MIVRIVLSLLIANSLVAWEPNLGEYAFQITTDVPAVQRLFGEGLMMLYNFDQPDARRFFEEALDADPNCAMCAWGVAHSYGPFINQPIKPAMDMVDAFKAANRAHSLLSQHHSKKEHALISAMFLRYPSDPHADQVETYRRYASSLRASRDMDLEGLGSDPDMMVFDAEAMMDLMSNSSGYHFYESRGDKIPPLPGPGIKEATSLLRRALAATNSSHPYGQHLLIHSTEMSKFEADDVVSVAQHLMRQMAPYQSQHLQHMVSHTFIRTGHYHEGVEGNVAAVHSDAALMHHNLQPYGPGHDSAFLVASALWGGERATAYKYAAVMQDIFRRRPGDLDFPTGSLAWSNPMIVPLRFGDWHLIRTLDSHPPGDYGDHWAYGYGVVRCFALVAAAAHSGRLQEIENLMLELRGWMSRVTAGSLEEQLAKIANYTASAVYAHARGNLVQAEQMMSAAVHVEMAMSYSEPPMWLLPTRECHGQALMNIGRWRDAEALFRESLHGYSFHSEPRCGWALLGLRMSLEGQQENHSRERAQEIAEVIKLAAQAWRHADVPLISPCSILSSMTTVQQSALSATNPLENSALADVLPVAMGAISTMFAALLCLAVHRKHMSTHKEAPLLAHCSAPPRPLYELRF